MPTGFGDQQPVLRTAGSHRSAGINPAVAEPDVPGQPP